MLITILVQVYTGPGIKSASMKFVKASDGTESDVTLGTGVVTGTVVSPVIALYI